MAKLTRLPGRVAPPGPAFASTGPVLRALSSCLGALLLAVCPAAAGEGLHGRLDMGFGHLFRGLQHVNSGPALSVYLEKSWSSGIYAGIWAGRTEPAYNPGRDREINYVVGYGHRLSRGIFLDTSIVHYHYPGALSYQNQEWTEWLNRFYIRDRWVLSYGLGEDWFSKSSISHFTSITFLQPLPRRLELELGAGAVFPQGDALVDNYRYAEAGLARAFGSFRLRGLVSLTDGDLRRALGSDSAGFQTSLTLSWHF